MSKVSTDRRCNERVMPGRARRAGWWLLLFLPLMIFGCGRKGLPGGSKMEARDLGFSMTAPAGWSVESSNPRMCSHGDGTGLIIDEPLEDKEFVKYAEDLSRASSANVISLKAVTVSGHEGIETVAEYPDQGSKALKLYIHKGDMLIEVSFVLPKEEFAAEEPALRESLSSITLK